MSESIATASSPHAMGAMRHALVAVCLLPALALARQSTPEPMSAQPRQAPPTIAPAPPGATIEQWGFDPAVLVADGEALLARAPDPAIDRLFQAVHASSQHPRDAQVLCALFDPQADRSLPGLNAIASGLGPASQERFANAVADVFVAAIQSPPQQHDTAAARQSLKAAGVRAALLSDGFGAGLNGDDHPARCRSVAMLLDVLNERPLSERAAVTRLLLGEGLRQLAGNPARTPPL